MKRNVSNDENEGSRHEHKEEVFPVAISGNKQGPSSRGALRSRDGRLVGDRGGHNGSDNDRRWSIATVVHVAGGR